MIQIAGISKRFGTNRVLDEVSLWLVPGRITAVVGPNAAGKSTLIKCILGLTRPDSGLILVDSKPIDDSGEYRAAIGYMPQIARFPDNITGRDLLDMIIDLRGNPIVHDDLIHLFELESHLRKPIRTMSGGTRQKINAVIALLFAPPILILDEPSAGLDPVSAGILKDRLRQERERGAIVVLTSHVLSEIEELVDDVAYLADGKIQFSGPLNDLKRVTRQFTLERAIAHAMTNGVAA